MQGSMLISGKKAGQTRLDLMEVNGETGRVAVSTNPEATDDHIIEDVKTKLHELKSSPTPIPHEISFLEKFLEATHLNNLLHRHEEVETVLTEQTEQQESKPNDNVTSIDAQIDKGFPGIGTGAPNVEGNKSSLPERLADAQPGTSPESTPKEVPPDELDKQAAALDALGKPAPVSGTESPAPDPQSGNDKTL